jgi:hypothetical protein
MQPASAAVLFLLERKLRKTLTADIHDIKAARREPAALHFFAENRHIARN